MTYTVEMRRSQDITDAEVRRRLAACYSLLLDLAEKHKNDAPDDGCENQPHAPGDRPGTDCQESGCTKTKPGTGTSLSDDESLSDD